MAVIPSPNSSPGSYDSLANVLTSLLSAIPSQVHQHREGLFVSIYQQGILRLTVSTQNFSPMLFAHPTVYPYIFYFCSPILVSSQPMKGQLVTLDQPENLGCHSHHQSLSRVFPQPLPFLKYVLCVLPSQIHHLMRDFLIAHISRTLISAVPPPTSFHKLLHQPKLILICILSFYVKYIM